MRAVPVCWGFLALAALGFVPHVASAAVVMEVEPNDSIATAQNIDGNFTLDFSPDIGNTTSNTSTTIPHVTIVGTGNDTVDCYSFTVTTAGTLGIFDVDYGMNDFDPWIELFTATGNILASNDDAPFAFGQGGSTHAFDSYLEYTFAAPGLYVIIVGRSPVLEPIPTGADYQLQVSLANASAVPEPASLCLWGFGVLAGSIAATRPVRRRCPVDAPC